MVIIATELNMHTSSVNKYLRDLRIENFIKLLYIEDGFKVYISKTFQVDIMFHKVCYDRLKSFIYYLNTPFTVKMIVSELEIDVKKVHRYIPMMLKEQYIKVIGRDKGTKIYVINRYKMT